MPIRFVCPHCRQRLSVSTRKAGTAADCPRCKVQVTIPQPPAELAAPPQPDTGHDLSDSILVAEPIAAPTSEPLAIEPPPKLMEVSAAAPVHSPPVPRAVEAPTFSPDTHDSAGMELAVDHSADQPEQPVSAPPRAPAAQAGFIVVPRYVIYTQGALLAAVAFTAFFLGVLMGGTFLRRPAAKIAAQEAVVSGSITYTTGPRSRPDRGAVIVLIPTAADAAGERAQVAGLRPSDPSPDADHRGLGVIRQFGGSYTRADANGRFETRLPLPGRYWLLVISHEKRNRAASDTADIRKLSRFFDSAADLLEDRQYRLTQETIRGDQQLEIAFD